MRSWRSTCTGSMTRMTMPMRLYMMCMGYMRLTHLEVQYLEVHMVLFVYLNNKHYIRPNTFNTYFCSQPKYNKKATNMLIRIKRIYYFSTLAILSILCCRFQCFYTAIFLFLQETGAILFVIQYLFSTYISYLYVWFQTVWSTLVSLS